MLLKDFKYSISLFFLASFLLLRVVNLHAFSHFFSDNDFHHCEYCIVISNTNSGTPLDLNISQPNYSLETPLDFSIKNDFICYVAPYQKILYSDYSHNKPPPIL